MQLILASYICLPGDRSVHMLKDLHIRTGCRERLALLTTNILDQDDHNKKKHLSYPSQLRHITAANTPITRATELPSCPAPAFESGALVVAAAVWLAAVEVAASVVLERVMC